MDSRLELRLSQEAVRLRGNRSSKEIVMELVKRTGLAENSAYAIINKIENGGITNGAIHNISSEKISQRNLELIAIYLSCLEIKPQEPIVLELKQYDSRFKYPISSSRKPRRQYAPR